MLTNNSNNTKSKCYDEMSLKQARLDTGHSLINNITFSTIISYNNNNNKQCQRQEGRTHYNNCTTTNNNNSSNIK
jgi:hypothetical protein